MLTADKLEDLKKFFEADKFAMKSGCELIEADINYAKAQMRITSDHRNAMGGVMGGAIFTLADFTFAAASNQDGRTVAQNMSVTFVANTQDDLLVAEAKCIKNGRSTCLYGIEVLDGMGKQIAYFQANGFHLNL